MSAGSVASTDLVLGGLGACLGGSCSVTAATAAPTRVAGTNYWRFYVTGTFSAGLVTATFAPGAFARMTVHHDVATAVLRSDDFGVTNPTSVVPGPARAALVLAAALLPGIAAYGSYSVMQRTLGAAKVGLVLYLGPLYSAALAALVLGERIEVFHVVGAVLILPGMWLATRRA